MTGLKGAGKVQSFGGTGDQTLAMGAIAKAVGVDVPGTAPATIAAPTLPDIPKTTAPDIPKPVESPVVNDFIDTRPIEDRTPKAPTLSDPATMPSMGSKAVTAAGGQTRAAIAARAGRASTVLTTRKTTASRPTGTLASGPDTYSKRTLG